MYVANNHELGLEQIYLRPVRRGDDVLLRVTLVAYERIVDILEVDVKLPDALAKKSSTPARLCAAAVALVLRLEPLVRRL